MRDTVNIDVLLRKRDRYVGQIQKGLNELTFSNEACFLALVGPSGSGKLDTMKVVLNAIDSVGQVIYSNGNKVSYGYFAGFYELYTYIHTSCEKEHPNILATHEQTLKRLFPFIHSDAYVVPKDLTNTASQEERTRFYHHEFQEKLLHGIWEFFLDYCQQTKQQFTIVIDQSEVLPPTIQSLLQIMTYRKQLNAYLHVVLLFDQEIDYQLKNHCYAIQFIELQLDEACGLLDYADIPSADEKLAYTLLKISGGNPSRYISLLNCLHESIPVFDYLSFDTYMDFYLSQKGDSYRYAMLKEYIDGHCVNDCPVMKRNYQVMSSELKDLLHRRKILELQKGNVEKSLMHLIHIVSLSSEVEQLSLLAPISIKLQEIGVYNTWFDLFSKYFINSNLRVLPDGDELHNAVFVRVSFILYSLGISKLSIPYLESFYTQFPESKLTPMILYSQSMTYGRYQLPVDLDKAEYYALLNLEKIETTFKDHPKYVYVKVFAENALAYIRARQGRLEEAIELCTSGLDRMKEIYGEQKYALHQSILVYNTGQVYEILGDFKKAYEMYDHAIQLDPYYGEYYNDLANLLQNHGQVEQSLYYYERAIDLCPPYYEAHINRANAYEKMGKIEEAKLDYLPAIELKPDASYVYGNLSTIYYQEEMYEKALKLVDQAIYHNTREAQFHNTKGLILQELQQEEQARECFQTAIIMNPKLSEAYNNAAVLAYSTGHYEDSLELVNRAIELNQDPDYRINRGILYKELNQLQNAMTEFEVARNHKVTDEFLENLIRETAAILEM